MTLSWTPIVFHELSGTRGLDQDPDPGPGAIRGVENPHPVVGETQLIHPRVGVPEGCPKRLVEGIDRTVAVAGGDLALRPDHDIHGRLGHHRLVGPPLDEGAERLDREEGLHPAQLPPHQQLERTVRCLELITHVFELLDSLEDRTGLGIGQLEAELG